MKRIITVLLLITLLLSCGFCFVCSADDNTYAYTDTELPCLLDSAGLLNQDDYKIVEYKLLSVGNKHNIDVVIVTVNGLGENTAEAFADDFYDYNGYGRGAGKDGCLLLVDMQSRSYHISTTGSCITYINDDGIDYISDGFIGFLKSGDYYSAFMSFADDVDNVITSAKNGNRISSNSGFKWTYLLMGLALGLIVAAIVTVKLYSQLKSVKRKAQANDYLVEGSFALTKSRDIYRGTYITKTPRPKNNSSGSSTHTGSSGTSHGGGGGSF